MTAAFPSLLGRAAGAPPHKRYRRRYDHVAIRRWGEKGPSQPHLTNCWQVIFSIGGRHRQCCVFSHIQR